MTNSTLQDAAGMTLAMPVFALALFTPGYILGWATNLFGFRQMRWPHRLPWAIVYSFAFTPILTYWAGKYANLSTACAILLTFGIVASVLCLRDRPRLRPAALRVAAAVMLWSAFVFFMLADLQFGHKLYFSAVEFDQSYRVAFTQSVLRSGVPPANPLYFAGSPQPMRYYYLWYVVCAAIAKLAHVSARQAFFAGTAWAGIGLASIVALFARHFSATPTNTRRRATIAIALLAITGADLLPAIGAIFAGPLNADMEWWSVDQISSWQDSILWVPHHTAALIACLVSILLVRKAQLEHRHLLSAGILAGAAFASAFGMSVYLAAGAAILFAAWLLRLILQRQSLRPWLLTATAMSLSALCLLTPLLREFFATTPSAQASGTAGHVLKFGLREIIDAAPLVGIPPFRWFGPHAASIVSKITLLPLGLALELGLYAVTLWLLLRARRKGLVPANDHRNLTIFLALCGLVMVCCVRSTVIGNNDFGYRAAMLPQFFLLLLAAEVLADWWPQPTAITPRQKRVLAGFLALGLAGTLYQAVILRTYLPLEERIQTGAFAHLPTRLYDAQQALRTLQQSTPQNAVWQYTPFETSPSANRPVVPAYIYYDRALLMYGGRQVLNAEETCAAVFGGDTRSCDAIMQQTAITYTAATTAREAQTYCHRFGVSYLAASDIDAPWANPASWVWTLPVLATQPTFRILRCAG